MTERLAELTEWVAGVLANRAFAIAPASIDASFRRYYRVSLDGGSWIAMDAPPPMEDCRPYVDIAARLAACGVSVPRVLAADLARGFLLLTDLGSELYLDALFADNADALYADALGALLKIQTEADWRGLPDYDQHLLLMEMELFREWLLGRHLQIPLGRRENIMLSDVFQWLCEIALSQPRVFVHRDYHSRNLLRRAQDNPGIVDFQDAVYGPVSYDLVSLLKDCYIKWPRARQCAWAGRYADQLRDAGLINGAEHGQFLRWFDLMGAQRHLKASGIFARLYHRDGKPGFLSDIPRTLSYIADLAGLYPELDGLIGLIRRKVLPALKARVMPCSA